jgi:hypothetical protein
LHAARLSSSLAFYFIFWHGVHQFTLLANSMIVLSTQLYRQPALKVILYQCPPAQMDGCVAAATATFLRAKHVVHGEHGPALAPVDGGEREIFFF